MPYLRIGGLPKREGVVLGCINDRLALATPEPAELRWDLHARDESGAIGLAKLIFRPRRSSALRLGLLGLRPTLARAQLAEQPAARWLDTAADVIQWTGVEIEEVL